MVSINDAVVPTAHPATPFGGAGFSGWGSTQGPEGLLGMTVPQVVSVRNGKSDPITSRPAAPADRSIACCKACLSGDTCRDLDSGFGDSGKCSAEDGDSNKDPRQKARGQGSFQ